MSYQLTLENIPLGHVVKAAKPGDEIQYSVRGFASSEDGDAFIKLLEGFPNDILNMLPKTNKVKPSMVDHLLVIIRADKALHIYVNEINLILHAVPKQAIKQGEWVSDKDIADIERVNLEGINIPKDAAVMILFSCGWRKALYYDFWPINPYDPTPRNYDIEVLMGQMFGYLAFQHMFKINTDEWNSLFDQQWFPFISLSPSTIRKMIEYGRNGWQIDDLLPAIITEAESLTTQMNERWKGNSFFSNHIDVLNTGIERFLSHDYISCIHTLFPRIEGILRTHHIFLDPASDLRQKSLSNSVLISIPADRQSNSLLLPAKFCDYLFNVYFKDFDPGHPQGVSRNTVSHGVTPQADLNEKGAVLAILILDQLAFSLR